MSATFQELGRRADEASKAVREVYRYLETEGNNGKSVNDLVAVTVGLAHTTRTAQSPAVQAFMTRLGAAIRQSVSINGLAEQVMDEMRAEAAGNIAMMKAELDAIASGQVPTSAEAEAEPGKPYASAPRGRANRGAQTNG